MIPGDVPQWIVLVWLFTFGAVIGSFLNVCIYRLPKHDRLWAQLSGLNHPPSSCPFCKNRIQARDNIPVLGWLMLRGRCRFCRHWIPPRYALIEFFNGVLWVVLYMAIVPAGFSAKASESCLWSGLSPLAAMPYPQQEFVLNAQYFYYLIMAEALLVATFIDFDLMIIPDGSTVPAMIVGVLGAFLIGNLQLWPVWFQSLTLFSGFPDSPVWQPSWLAAHPHLHGLVSSLAGLIVGGGSIWTFRIVGHWAYGREVMGFGDVILMAMIGSFLGWQPTLVAFFVAPFCGLAAKLATMICRRSFVANELPYGPYLSLGALLVLVLWRPCFSDYFQNVFGLGPLFMAMAVAGVGVVAAMLIAMRTVKRWLGFKEFDEFEFGDEWRSGDQLAFYANKDYETGSAELKPRGWPGAAAGQGRQFVDRWRHGDR